MVKLIASIIFQNLIGLVDSNLRGISHLIQQKITKLHLNEVNNHSAEAGWSQELMNVVVEFSDAWFNLGACEVGFFLSEKGRNLACNCVYPDMCGNPLDEKMIPLIKSKNPINITPNPNKISSP